ncbi:MAG: DinB family protein [Candidatus Dormibacteraceae bacterium]
MIADLELGPESVVMLMASAPEHALDLVGGLDVTRLVYRHGPAFPSIRELVGHLATAGCGTDALVHRIYLEGLSEVPARAFDPAPAAGPDPEEPTPPADEQLQDCARSRRRTVDLLRGMRPGDWQRPVVDPELGEMTLLDLCRLIVAHEMSHLSQLRNLHSLLPEPQDVGPAT